VVQYIHPERNYDTILGRSKKSDVPKINVRDFVDIEKAKALIDLLNLVDFTTLIKLWPMFLNDTLGDCTCAAAAHAKQVFCALVGEISTVTDANVSTMYQGSGWKPGDAASDQGWTLVGAAKWMMTKGLLGTPDITAYAEVSLDDEDAQQVAMELFGGLYEGASMPTSAQTQYQAGWIWRETNNGQDAGGWGGHCMYRPKSLIVPSYVQNGRTVHVTWGGMQTSTYDWDQAYIDELVALVPANWAEKMPPALVQAGIVDFLKLQSLVTQYQS
jgi:hypothetical protein